MKKSFAKITITLLFVAITICFIMHPTKYMGCFFDGITVWGRNILPAIFPFAFLATLYTKFSQKGNFKVCSKIFNIDCDDLLLTSILCGYPVGAKAISASNADSKTATAMTSFCSTPGPIFVIATIGAELLKNTCATIIVVVSQLLASLLNGATYTRKQTFCYLSNDNDFVSSEFGKTLTDCILAILSVGGLVAMFFMLTQMAQDILPNTIANSPILFFAMGLLEMTSGIIAICQNMPLFSATVLTSTLLAFGGICVFLQCYAFLSQKGVKASAILKMKATQSAYATIISFTLSMILLR